MWWNRKKHNRISFSVKPEGSNITQQISRRQGSISCRRYIRRLWLCVKLMYLSTRYYLCSLKPSKITLYTITIDWCIFSCNNLFRQVKLWPSLLAVSFARKENPHWMWLPCGLGPKKTVPSTSRTCMLGWITSIPDNLCSTQKLPNHTNQHLEAKHSHDYVKKIFGMSPSITEKLLKTWWKQ